MSKRKAEQDASDSDSDQSVPDNFSSVGPVPSYEICIDKAVLKIEVDLIVETDEERCLKFVELLNSAKVGSEIVNALKTLNSSGQKFAIFLTMDRVLKALGLLKLLDETDMTNKWGKESKNPKLKVFKEKVESSITDFVYGSNEWTKFLAVILEGFIVKKKKSKRVVELVPFAAVSHLTNSRVCDRIAFLSCALADPDLITYWTHLAKPVEANARPG